MKHNWVIQTYEDDDQLEAIRLLNIVYGKWHDIKYWVWKYKNNPAGFFKNDIQLAKNVNNEIIGYFAVIPLKMQLNNVEILGSLGVDLATHQEYQRQGIFTALANKLYAEAAKNDLQITYAFPLYQEPAYKGHIKMNWSTLCIVPNFVKRFSLDKFLEGRIKNKILLIMAKKLTHLIFKTKFVIKKTPLVKDLIIEKTERFDERFNVLWEKLSSQYKIIVVRNKDHLNWRYVSNPEKNYIIFKAEKKNEVLGFIVLHTEEHPPYKIGYIVDIFSIQDKLIMQNLITKSLEYFKNQDVNSVNCWMLKHHSLYFQILRENGFTARSSGIALIARKNISKISNELFCNPKNWFITMGDNDGL